MTKKQITILGIVVLVLCCVASVLLVLSEKNTVVHTTTPEVATTTPVVGTTTEPVATEEDVVEEISYNYLFESLKEDEGVVEYFGGGSFAWYVPGWIASNWRIVSPAESFNMEFAPLEREVVTDFSNISFTIVPSTEAKNAETLYSEEVRNREGVLIHEILLNKHTSGSLALQIDSDTRIYHIQRQIGERIRDVYYIDGVGKTLMVTFEARAEIFHHFDRNIRSMVGGVGALSEPQG